MATALDVVEVVYKRLAEGDIEGFLALWPITSSGSLMELQL